MNDGYGWTGTASCDLPPLVSVAPDVVETPEVEVSTPDAPTTEQPVDAGDWWQPRASESLKWQIQLQGIPDGAVLSLLL